MSFLSSVVSPSISSPHLSFAERYKLVFARRALMPMVNYMFGVPYPPQRKIEFKYGDHREEVLDYTPALSSSSSSSSSSLPDHVHGAIFYIHGGGWVAGSRSGYGRPLLRFSDAGFPVYSVDYPLSPEAAFGVALVSLLKAAQWMVKTQGVKNVHVMGDSAGGNLAMMIAVILANTELVALYDSERVIDVSQLPRVLSCVAAYGVHDRVSWIEDGFLFAREFMIAYAGPDAVKPEWKPVKPVTALDFTFFNETEEFKGRRRLNVPPSFIVCGTADKLLRSSKLLFTTLKQVNEKTEYKEYIGANHGFLADKTKQGEELRADILTFLDKHDQVSQ